MFLSESPWPHPRNLFERPQHKLTLCRHGAHSLSDMRDLLSFDRYSSWSAFSTRTALVMAVLWGAPMTLLMLLGMQGGFGAAGTVVVGTLAGLGFGFGWTAWMRVTIRRFLERLHAGDPSVVPAPPAGATERVLCNFMLSERFAVGGHLYLSDVDWTFVPHLKNLQRHQQVHSVSSRDITSITVRRLHKGALARLMYPDDVDVIEARTASAIAWSVIAPQPQELAALLSARIRGAA
jgi:hypothetical protein